MTRNVWRRAVVVAVLLTAVAGPVAVGVASAATTTATPAGHAAAPAGHAAAPAPARAATGTAKKARIYSMVHNAASVPVHTAPRNASTVVRTLKKAGGKVSLACGVTGDAVGRSTTWYRTAGSPVGYVNAAYLHSTHTPAPRIPHC